MTQNGVVFGNVMACLANYIQVANDGVLRFTFDPERG